MALTMSTCVVLGYVGQDPKVYASGVCTFSVATSEPKKDAKDSDDKITSWFSCVAFGKAARVACGGDGDYAFEAAIVGIVDAADVPGAAWAIGAKERA